MDAFRDFEHAGWEGTAEAYHRAFAALTTQSIDALLDAAAVKRGMRVLDVASGPGYVAAAAAARGAQVTGVDFSCAMVEQARKRYPGVSFEEDDAEALSFAEGSFDAVVMNFGLLHLAQPDRALAEARRVLRPGGRFSFTVWAPPEETHAFGIVLRAIQRHGTMDVGLPAGPPFFRFSDAEESRASLVRAGLADPVVTRVPQVWRLPAAETLFDCMLESTVRTGALMRAQSAAALGAIRAAITQEAQSHRKAGGVELPMPAVLASASKTRSR